MFALGTAPGAFAAPSRSSCWGRKSTVSVSANKLIKGANRPAEKKKKSSSASKKAFELNLQRLCTEPEYLPARQIGPVEVAVKSGRGRCVTAKEDLRPGALLFVSETVGSPLTGQLGQQLQPQHLQTHWTSGSQKLTAADRYKLSLLHSPGSQGPPAAVSFKDFSDDKASTKAKKAAASSKGFGAAAAKAASTAAAVATELSSEQLEAILKCNAYGDDHLDGGLTACRQEQQASIIGVWPEFSLLNHSCAPNTAAPVLLAPDRLLLRSALGVPAGEELTTSYLGLAGGMPLRQRRHLLQQLYGFSCNCPRCKGEESAPADVQATLDAMHAWSSTIDSPQLLQMMAQGDSAAVQQIHDKAAGLVQQLEQQLGQVTEPVAVSWLKASAYGTYALLLRTTDWLASLRDLHAAQTLADLVKVFAPASEPHLLLLADSAARSAESAAAGKAVAPEDSQELRVQRFVQALVLRYGEVRQLDVLTALAGAATSALGPHWLGLQDINGHLGLDKLVKEAAAATDSDGSGRQKVELNLGQLGLLGAASAAAQQEQ